MAPIKTPPHRPERPTTGALAALGRTAGGVAHDVDNALTAIVTHATLIQTGSGDAQAVAHAEAILRAARRASEVVERVRSVLRERPEAAGRVAVDLDALVLEALSVAASRAAARGVAVRRGAGAVGAGRVAGQPTELLQVVVNLVHNAIDASAPGAIVEVAAAVSDGEAIVSVRDRGAGIPEAILARVFEPFFTTKGAGGTGLGLALARSIAEGHGGVLTLASTTAGPDHGTIARLALPLSDDTALPAPRPPTDVVLDGSGGGTVLLVDDDEATRDALATLLAADGFAVVTAADPDGALAAFHAARPDVVVTDLQLGQADGGALVLRLAALDPRVPIVVASGAVAQVSGASARAWAGKVAATFEKPLSPGRLVARLRELVARGRALARERSTGGG